KEDRVRVEELKESEALWLQEIGSGISLWEATETALGFHPDFELRLAHWVAGEIFTGFESTST
ncbi:MAG: hypothetical protein HKL98_13285, partial [Burkholderiales bacterium]|nr:hypothetical protein [Burkholderiales bacterium]